MSTSDPYFLGYRQVEQERLERQADELADDSASLFDRIGVADGWRAIEIGCGPRGCLALLSARVGAGGSVVGVERNEALVERAEQFVTANHLTNVQVKHADARGTPLPTGTFDLATARLVLVNVPQPEQLLAEMVRLVRPGGVVALHEPDSTTQRVDPPLPAQDRLLQLLNDYAARNGIDRTIGLRVPRLMRAAGIVDVRTSATVHVYPPEHGRRMLLLEFVENARQGMLELNLISAGELDELTGALRDHLQDTATLVLSSVFVQAWGYTPA